MVRRCVVLVAALLTGVAGCASGPPPQAREQGRTGDFRIAVSMFSLSSTAGVAQLKGVKEAAARNGDRITLAADGRFDAEKQGRDMQDAIASRPDAIILAAGDTAQARSWVDQAAAAGIPVFDLYFAIDHFGDPLYKGVLAGVQIDETRSGELAGELAARHVAPGRTVGVVLGAAGYAEVDDRLAGFRAGLATNGDHPTVVSENGDWTPEFGQTACQQLISANPGIALIYNESDDLAAGCAKATNRGDVLVVGNGGSQQSLPLVATGEILGTTCYKMVDIGQRVAQQAHDHLAGVAGYTPGLVRLDPELITKENLADCPGDW